MQGTSQGSLFSRDQCLNSDFSFPVFFGIILLAVLFGLDIATTNEVLIFGGYEKNGFMALVTLYPALHLVVKGLVITFIALVVQVSECRIRGSGLCALLALILLYSYVIYNNTLVLQGLVQGY